MRELQLLARYKELTRQQKERLEQGDIEGALELTDEKDRIFSTLQAGVRQRGVQTGGEERKERLGSASVDPSFQLLLQEALTLNEEVVTLMRKHQAHFANELRKIQHGRQVQDVYGMNPVADACFFDKKK